MSLHLCDPKRFALLVISQLVVCGAAATAFDIVGSDNAFTRAEISSLDRRNSAVRVLDASLSVTVFVSSNVTSALSSGCLASLTATLDCSTFRIDPDALYIWGGLTAEDLDVLYTDSCTNSINSFRASVLTACADDVYTDPVQNGTGYVPGTGTLNEIYNVEAISSMRPIATVDYYFLNYNLTCLKDV